jgi:MFS family permease
VNKTKRWMPWLVWGLGACYVLYQFLLQSSISVMIPPLKASFHIDQVGIGMLSSSFFYTYLLMQIPAGMLVDRLGPRRMLTFSIVIASLSCFLFASVHELHLAEASRMLMGFVAAPSVVAALALGAHWFPPARFAFIVGLTEMFGMLGGALGQVVLAHCIETSLGWRGTMAITGFLGILLAMLVWTFVFDYPQSQPKEVLKEEAKLNVAQMLTVFSQAQVWIVGLYSGLMFAVLSGFASLWSIVFLQKSHHLDLNTAALAGSMVFVGAALGSPLFGYLAARYHKAKAMMSAASLIVFVLISGLLFVKALSLTSIFVVLFLLGLFASSYVLPFALASEMVNARLKGTTMGFINMLCIIIGAPFLQFLVGVLLHMSNNHYAFALSVFPVSFLLAFILVFFVKQPARGV